MSSTKFGSVSAVSIGGVRIDSNIHHTVVSQEKAGMEVTEITADLAEKIETRDESLFFDRKSKDVTPKDIAKHAVGLANADGGELVIGIQDARTSPTGANRWYGFCYIEEMNPIFQTLTRLPTALPCRFEIVSCSERDGLCLRIYVEKSGHVCQATEGLVYQRVNASTVKITDPQKIAELQFTKGQMSYENTELTHVRPEIVYESSAIQNFQSSSLDAQDPLAYCFNEDLITFRECVPKAAGVLLFADNPAAHFPKRCGVKITHYDTSLEEVDRDTLKDVISLEAPLYDLIHDSVSAITKRLSDISFINANNQITKVEYPAEAIWEILVNSLIHRDYSISDDVQVLIFQNRIEFLSPGRLPGFVTVKNIYDVRYNRNPKIVRSLHKYRNPPNRDIGEGLNTALQRMTERRLKPPEFEEVGNAFRVRPPHAKLASSEEMVLEYLQNNPYITNSTARSITGEKSENRMKNVFYRLRDNGNIRRVVRNGKEKNMWELNT